MQKLNWFERMVYKWQKRKMCNCTSPIFEVKNKMLYCRDCNKPLHKLDVEMN